MILKNSSRPLAKTLMGKRINNNDKRETKTNIEKNALEKGSYCTAIHLSTLDFAF